MGSSFEDRLAEARAQEERAERDRREKVAAAEQEAAVLRRLKVEAAAAGRALLPEVYKAARALSSERGELKLEKVQKDGWFSARHVGWIVKARGRKFEVPFSGRVTVHGQSLEVFVENGRFTHVSSWNDSDNSYTTVSYVTVSEVLDEFITEVANALAQKHR